MLPLLLGLSARSSDDLYTYLKKPDASFRCEVTRPGEQIRMTSQTWQGEAWQHTVEFTLANASQSKNTAVLFVTGGHADRKFLTAIADKTRMPSAVLDEIPKQPLYNGLTEDRLIAYTFQRYLETGDGSWPLLFPMTKSVIRAMDAIESATAKTKNPIRKFIVTGASKRGWTTWFVGASRDRRVVGIAPMVIDNLNITEQMKAQKAEWGQYSDQIEAYSTTGLLDKLAQPEGTRLSQIVDPYTYRDQIKVPTLIVKGANDPYWTVDAMDRYWGALKMPKWVVTVPNVGHNLGGGAQAIETLGAFCQAVAGKATLPVQKWSLEPQGSTCSVSLASSGGRLVGLKVWSAEAKDLDFRSSVYRSSPGLLTTTGAQASIPIPGDRNVALFGEATYELGASKFRLCSPTKLIVNVRPH